MKHQNEHRIFDEKSEYVKYRRILVDWLADIQLKFHLQPHTTHVAVMYMDRIMQTCAVPRDSLQIVSLVCLLIASKYEEREIDVPTIDMLVQELKTSDVTSSKENQAKEEQRLRKHIVQIEIMILNRLKWDLSEYTPLHFLAHFLHKGVLFENDMIDSIHENQEQPSLKRILKQFKRYTNFFAELALQDYAFQAFPSSVVAAAIVVATRKAIHIVPMWRPELEGPLCCTAEEIRDCVALVLELHHEHRRIAMSVNNTASTPKVDTTSSNSGVKTNPDTPDGVDGISMFE